MEIESRKAAGEWGREQQRVLNRSEFQFEELKSSTDSMRWSLSTHAYNNVHHILQQCAPHSAQLWVVKMVRFTLWYDYYHNKIITPFLVKFSNSKQQIQNNLFGVVLTSVGYLHSIKKITMSRSHSESLQYPARGLFLNKLLFIE